MKAGIAIDAWKLPIFERHLTGAGYSFTSGAGVTADTLMLYVETARGVSELAVVVKAANDEAARSRAH